MDDSTSLIFSHNKGSPSGNTLGLFCGTKNIRQSGL